MLKKLKKKLSASRITKRPKVAVIIRKERSTTKKRVHDPVVISKQLDLPNDHFIIYHTPGGYRFTLFSRIENTDPFEILSISHKAYKLKSEAIRTMKRMLRSIGLGSSSNLYVFAFDHKGCKINLGINYNIKMLL